MSASQIVLTDIDTLTARLVRPRGARGGAAGGPGDHRAGVAVADPPLPF